MKKKKKKRNTRLEAQLYYLQKKNMKRFDANGFKTKFVIMRYNKR